MDFQKRILTGRKVIYTDYDVITSQNVIEVLNESYIKHTTNRAEIDYLYKYYRGLQPVYGRTKVFNEHVLNKVVVNRANEIVTFKTGYLMGEPVQYTARNSEDSIAEGIQMLNDCCYAEGKDTKDIALADWFHICGTSYRMVIPDRVGEEDDSPFEIYTLDPRNTFVVYHSGLGHEPTMGVSYVERNDGEVVFSIYTKNRYFEVIGGQIVKEQRLFLNDIPIIEYPANESRLGAFEIVIELLDAINEVESDRLDGIDQFIQALLVFKGVDIDDESFKKLKENGGLKIPSDADVEYLVQELNQASTQTLSDALYEYVLTICGMPNRNGGSSTSDTGSAVILRDGWGDAEARAKDGERMFKMSEKRFLKIALFILSEKNLCNIKVKDIDITFTRRYYENNLQKVQALVTMLSNNKIHPRLAFVQSGLFIDPEKAYRESESYAAEQEKKAEEKFNQQLALKQAESEQDTNEDNKQVTEE